MLQSFIGFPEFAKFTEILFYLGKTQLQWKFENLLGEKQAKIHRNEHTQDQFEIHFALPYVSLCW